MRPTAAAPRPSRSFTAQILGAVLGILVMGGLLVGLSTWWNGQQAARQAYDRILLGAARDIAEAIRIQSGAPFVDLPVSAFELLAQAPEDRVFYSVTAPDGRVITGMDVAKVGVLPPALRAGAGARGAPQFFDGSLQGDPARFLRLTRRFVERDFSGPVDVIVGQTLRARQAMTVDLMTNALLPMALAGAALVLIASEVLRRALRPLEALSRDLARRDPYDLTPMDVARLPLELQVMVGAMNRFMARLDGQIGAMRALISDTAHQLRTPVAAIRVQAEAALSEDAEDGRARALDRLLTRTRSLGRLLDQLLSRALVIHRSDNVPRVALDLREVALDIVEQGEADLLAPEADIRLVIGDDPVRVRADAFSLTEAGKNLLANAIKHGTPPICVGAEREGAHARLWVSDAGQGPDPRVTERLGERFNRSTATREGGTGLGLSIVSAVAEAFDGEVEMVRSDNGFRTALRLPILNAEAPE